MDIYGRGFKSHSQSLVFILFLLLKIKKRCKEQTILDFHDYKEKYLGS